MLATIIENIPEIMCSILKESPLLSITCKAFVKYSQYELVINELKNPVLFNKLSLMIPPSDNLVNKYFTDLFLFINRTTEEYFLCRPIQSYYFLLNIIGRWDKSDTIEIHAYIDNYSTIPLGIKDYGFVVTNFELQVPNAKYMKLKSLTI